MEKLHQVELHYWYSSSNNVTVINSRILRWEVQVACMMEPTKTYSLDGKETADGNTIFKRVLEKQSGME
jgi:hypothetical protein